MFGLSNDQNQNAAAQVPPTAPAAPPAEITESAPSTPTIPDPMVTPAPAPASAPEINSADSVNSESGYSAPEPQIGPAKVSEPNSVPTASSMAAASPAQAASDDGLAQVRQQAINSLQPLVGHLDQAPEDKFKTLMMLIQTSNNSKLLSDAYEAANKITDEKARAQALLDVVNETNYFTHQQAKQ